MQSTRKLKKFTTMINFITITLGKVFTKKAKAFTYQSFVQP